MIKQIFLLTLVIKASLVFTEENKIITNKEIRGSQNLKNIVAKTPGRPFPKPQSQIVTDVQQILIEKEFTFQYGKGSVVCDLLSIAFTRFYKIIFRPQNYDINGNGSSRVKKVRYQNKNQPFDNQQKNVRLLKRVLINVQLPCEDYPTLESDESCLYFLSKI